MITTLNCQTISDLEKTAENIHKKIITIDSHTDAPLRMTRRNYDISKDHSNELNRGKIDIPSMKKGGLDAAYFAIFLGQGPCNEDGYSKALNLTMSIYEKMDSVFTLHKDKIGVAVSSDDFYRFKEEGKVIAAIGIENGYPIGTDISLIQKFHSMGIRYITLCHTKNNQLCASSTDPDTTIDFGLTNFGKSIVKEMNKYGIMIDVSHASDKSVFDILNLSATPIIASHSCCRSLRDIKRNLPDSLIKMIADKGGVVQICFLGEYLKEIPLNPIRDSLMSQLRKKYNGFQNLSDSMMTKANEEWYKIDETHPGELAEVKDVVDHIDHVVKIAGIDHVGIGTDFDGGGVIKGCFDASEMKNVTIELLKRNYSEKDIQKIWGENFLRVLKANEKFSVN